MSPVTPKPAAEFSTLAITKSSDSRSTSAGTARRAISRPGLPKMSPMKRIRIPDGRMLPRADGDADLRAASIIDAWQDDGENAVGEGRDRAPGVERAVDAD